LQLRAFFYLGVAQKAGQNNAQAKVMAMNSLPCATNLTPTALIGKGLLLCFSLGFGVTAHGQALPELLPGANGLALKTWVFHPPQRTDGTPRPVVVALHGCGGLYATVGSRKGQLNARHQGMTNLLLAQGYSVVWPDSLTPRQETSLCEQSMASRKVRQSHRRSDVHTTLAWLAQQTWTDPHRVALLGWSHGGSTVLASSDSTQKLPQPSVTPDVALAFYPGCADALRQAYQPAWPVHMLLGAADDWTPAAPCITLGQQASMSFKLYPDSHHGFDNPVGQVQHLPRVPNGQNPGLGVHAGRNPVTGPQAWQDVLGLLRQRWPDPAAR
jgi:dienelactone hydrolase